MAEAEEILDVVNSQDEVVGQLSRTAIYQDLPALQGYLRSASVFIVNTQGELWIPRRGVSQKIKPGGLDYSAGGHVSSGESYLTGLLREIEEELNLRLPAADLLFIGKLGPEPPNDHYFSACYVYFSDEVPDYNRDDFSGYAWLAPAELLGRLEDGENAKDSLRGSVELWLRYQTEHADDFSG